MARVALPVVETGQVAVPLTELDGWAFDNAVADETRSLWDALREGAPLPTLEQVATAERIMEAVQANYRKCGEGTIIGRYSVVPYAHTVARDVLWLAAGESHRPPKEFQLRVSGGAPLAVCVGPFQPELNRGQFRPVQVVKEGETREVPTLGYYYGGCGRIFADTTRTSGRVWAQTCSECREKITAHKLAVRRRVQRSHRRGLIDPRSAS